MTCIRVDVQLPDENEVQVTLFASAVRIRPEQRVHGDAEPLGSPLLLTSDDNTSEGEQPFFPLDRLELGEGEGGARRSVQLRHKRGGSDGPAARLRTRSGSASPWQPDELTLAPFPMTKPPLPQGRSAVVLSPLDNVPGRTVLNHLGNIGLYLIKETTSLRENGGIAQFVQVGGLGDGAIGCWRHKSSTIPAPPTSCLCRRCTPLRGRMCAVAGATPWWPIESSSC